MDEFHVFSGGSFSLDPGAIFGMVPASSWGRNYSVNEKGRIRLAVNIPILKRNGKLFSFDSGLNHSLSEKSMSFFEISTNPDLGEQIAETMRIGEVWATVYSHLHFDHSGGLSRPSGNVFGTSKSIIQESEVRFARRPNDLSKGSYPTITLAKEKARLVSGSARISGDIRVTRTGGHSIGHQVAFFTVNERKYLYPGDIFPSSFHVRPTHIPAIDSYPVETLQWKKMLLKKAIDSELRVIFPHDTKIKVASISGTVTNPIVTDESTT